MTRASLAERRRFEPTNLYLGAIFVFLYLPVGVLIVLAFNDATVTSFPFQSFTWKWFGVLASDEAIGRGIVNSFIVVAATMAVVAVIGTLTAYTLVRYQFPGRLAVAALVFVPIVVPKSVLGISLVALTTALDIPRSIYTVIFGHVLFCFPYVTIVVASVFLRLDQSLIDASADLGAREWRTARKVVLPLIRNGVTAGLFVCFVLSFGEFSLSAFLAGREQTLPLVIYSEFRFKVTPKINALSTLVVAGNILLVILAEFYRSRGAALLSRSNAISRRGSN